MSKKSPISCSVCGLHYQYSYNLNRHWRNVHLNDDLKCRPRKLQFKHVKQAEEHNETCSKTCISILKVPTSARTRPKTKLCSECGHAFRGSYDLRRHWVLIHVPKELKCRPCLLHFPSAKEAEQHKEACPKTNSKPLVEESKKPVHTASTKMNFFEYDHPLMKIQSLDAPAKDGFRHRKMRKRRRRSTLPLIPRTPQGVFTVLTRSAASELNHVLNLSDSDSSDSEKEITSTSLPELRRDQTQSSSDDDSSEGTSEGADGTKLLEDLELSSDDESLHSDASEMTAPSNSDDDEDPKPAEPLLPHGLIGEGYFWVQPSPGPSVLENFKNTSLVEPTKVVFYRFNQVCWDYSVDRACLMFVDKLKALSAKRCVEVLETYYPDFEFKLFVLETNTLGIFGRLVMTLVLHFYRRNHFEAAGQLLKFLSSKLISPLEHLPIKKQEDVQIGSALPEEVALVMMCCTIYLDIHETDLAVNLMMKALTQFIQKNNLSALDDLKTLLHTMFNEMIKSKNNTPLLKLFKHIYHTQVDTEYPIDLSFFYSGVMSSHVASRSVEEQKLAIDLFEGVHFSLLDFESSEIPGRGLLIIAAEHRLVRARLTRILLACLNNRAYPDYDFDKFSLKFYSSMSKIEMQVYLEQFIFYCAIRIKDRVLEMKPYLEFEVVVAPNTARNYKYPVHRKILNVNHSREAALTRLSQVLNYCLEIPPSIPMLHILQPFGEGKFIMFEGVVEQLFRRVLKVDDLENFNAENCIFCHNCT